MRVGEAFGIGQAPGTSESTFKAGTDRLQIGGPIRVLDGNNKPIPYDAHLEIFTDGVRTGDFKWLRFPGGTHFETNVKGGFSPGKNTAKLTLSFPGTEPVVLTDVICKDYSGPGPFTMEMRQCPKTVYLLEPGQPRPTSEPPWYTDAEPSRLPTGLVLGIGGALAVGIVIGLLIKK